MDERVSIVNTWVDKGSGNHLGHVICERPPDMAQCPDVIMCRSTDVWDVVRQGKIAVEGDSEGNNFVWESAILTPVRGGKLRRRVHVNIIIRITEYVRMFYDNNYRFDKSANHYLVSNVLIYLLIFVLTFYLKFTYINYLLLCVITKLRCWVTTYSNLCISLIVVATQNNNTQKLSFINDIQ